MMNSMYNETCLKACRHHNSDVLHKEVTDHYQVLAAIQSADDGIE